MSQPKDTSAESEHALQAEPKAEPKARSRAGSRAGSKARATVPSRTDSHSTWVKSIPWDGNFYPIDDEAYKELPEVKRLNTLVKRSLNVPGWLKDKESPQYSPYRNRMKSFREVISALPAMIDSEYETNPDNDLSSDVEECLPFILHIRRHAAALQLSLLKAMESDRRHPLDTLGTLVWEYQSNEDMIYRTHKQLQIPLPATYCPIPDSCAFIPIIEGPSASVKAHLWPALSCFPTVGTADPDCKHILHWTTEFERDLGEAASKCQVVEGLVSALYQRRALGFPNHFVFGTAHHTQTTLEVLAATWVPSDKPVEPDARSAQEANVDNAVLPAGQANDPSASSLQVGNTTGDMSPLVEKAGDKNADLSIEDIKKYNKIVIYKIGVYRMSDIESLLRLYLLMRTTRILAQQYKDEIKKFSIARILQLSKEPSDIYKWAPPPLAKPTKRKRSNDWRSELGSTAEEPEDMMSDDQDDGSDSLSDSDSLDPMHIITGEVAKYTVKNYAYETNAGAYAVTDPYTAQFSTYQTV